MLAPLAQVFQDVLGIENFTKSEEAFAADALFLAYQSGDAASIQKTVQVGRVRSHAGQRIGQASESFMLHCSPGEPAGQELTAHKSSGNSCIARLQQFDPAGVYGQGL